MTSLASYSGVAVLELCLVKRVTGLCNLIAYIIGHLNWLIGLVVRAGSQVQSVSLCQWVSRARG